jgi:hypothetical protein
MPEIDGPETLAALRVYFPQVVCCFMTGDPGAYGDEVFRRMGAAHIFWKPFAADEAARVIRRLVNRPAQGGTNS